MPLPPNPRVAELKNRLDSKREAVRTLLAENPDHTRMTHGAVTQMSKLTDDIEALQVELDSTSATMMIHSGGEGPKGRNMGGTSIGEMIVNSDQFKDFRPHKGGASVEFDIPFEQKTVLDVATGFVPQSVRTGLILETPQMPPRIADLFAQTTTDQAAVAYMEETTFTNAAAETAENTTKPQSTLAFTERTSPVRKIATEMTLTEEVMADNAGLMDYINSRLPAMIQFREDQQLLTGNGTTPNLRGVNNFVGIQTQAKGADPTPDAIFKAMVLVFTSQFVPCDTVVIHPADWQDIRLLRTADGLYIFGDPSRPGPETIFGARLVQSTRQTQNTALVGAFRFGAAFARRTDLTIRLSNEHANNFTSNLITIVAEERVALVPYRAAAFCTVTGI